MFFMNKLEENVILLEHNGKNGRIKKHSGINNDIPKEELIIPGTKMLNSDLI